MNVSFYRDIIEDSPIAYAYSKMIYDEKGQACDFVILEVNAACERITGSKRENIIGKRATEVIPNLKELQVDWIGAYESVAANGVKKEFEQFDQSTQRWYRVIVQSPEKCYVVARLIDITREMSQLEEMERLIEISEALLRSGDEKFSYQKISDDFLKISGAKYATFNLFDEDGKSFTTKAITGEKGIVKKVSDILDFKLEEKRWEYTPELAEKIKGNTITRFNTLRELSGTAVPSPIIFLLEKMFNIGEVILIKITKGDIILGDFTLFMEKGSRFDKNTLVEVYTRQLAMLIIRKRAEEALMKEKKLTEAIFDSVPGMIYLYDNQSRLVRWNKRHEDMTGYSSEELSKMSLLDWYKGDEKSQESVMEGLAKTVKDGFGDAEADMQKKDGHKVPMYFTASPLYLDGNQYFVGIGMDITERKKREAEIFNLSYHDQLTGLYNRRFYEEELKRLNTKRNLPLTIVMGDVNGLKLINDSFGHVMGDMLLKKVAEVLRLGCREDDIICRLAGDEFVLILPKTNEKEAERIIQRITELSLNEKVGSVDISISFGYATKNSEKEDLEELFKNSEDRMYEKKLFESQSMRGKAIKAIINTLYERSRMEDAHSHGVSKLCKSMGEALGLVKAEIEELKSAGLLHDIGKIALDENIMNKADEFTEDELAEYNRHSDIGYRMLNTVHDMTDIANYVLYHHERWDGKGYPKGLKGTEIPLASRIIAIVDAYDKMISGKNYASPFSVELAIAELKKNAGSQFDPELVQVFVEKVLGGITH